MKMPFKRTLRVKLFVIILLGLILSISAFFAGTFALNSYMKNVYMSDTNTQKRSARQIQSFASYVTSHSIKATDTQALRAWQEQHDNVYILIYNNNDIVFDSDWMIEKKGAYKYVITNSETGEIIILLQDNYGNIRKIKRKASSSSESQKKSDAVTADEGAYYGNSSMLRGDLNEFDYDFYPVLFKDGVFDVCIVDYSDDTIKDVGEIAIFVICCILFIGVIIVYFGREIGRMRRLTNEVMDIKDVDINGPITIHGQDEICMLAENVDTMRQTIIEQLSREREAWQANSDLVTRMGSGCWLFGILSPKPEMLSGRCPPRSGQPPGTIPCKENKKKPERFDPLRLFCTYSIFFWSSWAMASFSLSKPNIAA